MSTGGGDPGGGNGDGGGGGGGGGGDQDPPYDFCSKVKLCCPVECDEPVISMYLCSVSAIAIPNDGTEVTLPADAFFYVLKQSLSGPIAIAAKITSITEIGDGIYDYTIESYPKINNVSLPSSSKTIRFNCRSDYTDIVRVINPATDFAPPTYPPIEGTVNVIATTKPSNASHIHRQKCCKVLKLNVSGPFQDPDFIEPTSSSLSSAPIFLEEPADVLTVTLSSPEDGNVSISFNYYIFEFIEIVTSRTASVSQTDQMETHLFSAPTATPGEEYKLRIRLRDDLCPRFEIAELDEIVVVSVQGGDNRRYFNGKEILA